MDERQLTALKTELKEHLSDTVRVVVNGKIDAINLKLSNYIEDDENWKKRAEPLVQTYENGNWLLGTLGSVLRGVVLVGAAIAAILALLSYLD